MRRLLIAACLVSLALAAHPQITPIPWRPKSLPHRRVRIKPSKTKAGKTRTPSIREQQYHMTFDKVTTLSPGVYVAEGNVRFSYEGMFLTADSVTYDTNNGTLWATGRVAVDFNDFTLSGPELHYDLNKKTGVMVDAFGVQEDGDFTVYGKEIRKIGDGWFEVVHGTFTSCNAAVPPWSIKVSRSKFHVDHYAFLHNPLFKIRRAPALYLPYLIWPLKPTRSTGFLIPEIGSSTSKGVTVNSAFYLAPSDWWDDTVYLDQYSREGIGIGEEFRYVPSTDTYGWFHGYYIHQKSDHRKRWDFTWTHIQNLKKGWYFVGDINLISDTNFSRAYQRDFYKGVISGLDSRLFLVRNWGPYSFTTKMERDLQYFTTSGNLVQKTLPGFELRSSLQPLGGGLYFGFESSADAFHKEWAQYLPKAKKYSFAYRRLDLHPFFEWPFHPFLWLDVTPRVGVRTTGYTKSLDKEGANYDGGSIWRNYLQSSLIVTGPRFFRKFKNGGKHVIEPYIKYDYVTKDADAARIPYFDEVDRVALNQSILKVGIRNRVYGARSKRLILESDLYQAHSFKEDLSRLGKRGSKNSPVTLLVRAWPTRAWSGDLRLRYDLMSHAIDSQSLSLGYRPGKKISSNFIRLSYLKTNSLGLSRYNTGTPNPPAEDIGLASSWSFDDGKITANPYLDKDLKTGEWRNQRLIFWYHGSCFSIGFEGGRRTIGGFRDTQYRFLISLKGAGRVLDLNGVASNY